MATFPTTPRSAFLTWGLAHTTVFDEQEGNIGLSASQVTAFTNAINAANAANQAQENARLAYRAAINTGTDAFNAARRSASLTTKVIRTFAETTNNPNVYSLAQIPPPSEGSIAPPPAKPLDLSVELNNASGALTLRWKASNPPGTTGTSYIIRRKLPSETAFSFLGVTGSKKFIDNSFTAGPDSVQYTVQGQRADSAGAESDAFIINFGRTPSGQMTAFVAGAGEGMKLAA
ncbi:MAG: hypothetical protein ACKVS8_14550 [Phycisphaerales bacterium]